MVLNCSIMIELAGSFQAAPQIPHISTHHDMVRSLCQCWIQADNTGLVARVILIVACGRAMRLCFRTGEDRLVPFRFADVPLD